MHSTTSDKERVRAAAQLLAKRERTAQSAADRSAAARLLRQIQVEQQKRKRERGFLNNDSRYATAA